jgi:Tol biopolymer transport system component
MNADPRFERVLPDILADLYVGSTPAYRDDLLGLTARTRQRPAWGFPGRWFPMADITSRPAFAPRLPWRALGVALVILALLIGVAVAYVGTHQTRLPAPFGPAANGMIVYAKDGDLYVGDPASGTSRLILGGAEDDSAPGYSPDGSRIAFIRTASPDTFDIYAIRPDGSELRRLTSSALPNGTWSQWAPDSRHIAVVHEVETTGCATTVCFTKQLDMFDATGSGSVQTIATADGMDYVQFRPPDAGELLYRAKVDGKWGLFAMDPDGASVRTLAQPTVPGEVDLSFGGATYSADGSRIFYQHGDSGGCCRLWVMNADGIDPHEFKPLGPAWDGSAVLSPDGTKVAYWHNANDGPAHGITVVRADGSGQPIETGPLLSGGAHWIWAPDSSTILMFPDDVDTGKAYLLDPAGGPWNDAPWTSTGDLDWQRIAPPG